MLTKLDATVFGLVFALLAGACGDSPAPSAAPSVVTPVPSVVTPVPRVVTITVYLSDTVSRSLAGVSVKVVDGPQAGALLISGADGLVSISGTFVDRVTLRAAKEGYVTATHSLDLRSICDGCTARITFRLESLAPPANIEAGDYTLTLLADDLQNIGGTPGPGACADFPNDLRTRTYAATITPAINPPHSPHYNVTVGGPILSSNGFGILVAGNYLAVEVDMGLFEHFPPFTYLSSSFVGGTSVETLLPVSTISMPVDLVFDYCVLNSDKGRQSNCQTTPQDQVITRSVCQSKNGRLILARR